MLEYRSREVQRQTLEDCELESYNLSSPLFHGWLTAASWVRITGRLIKCL